MTTACIENATAVGGSHACAEAVLVHALALGGLECSFHISVFYIFRIRDCKGSKILANRKIYFSI